MKQRLSPLPKIIRLRGQAPIVLKHAAIVVHDNDPWTARAEERLVALDVLKSYPGLKGKIFTRRRVIGQALDANIQSIQDFQAVTEDYMDWPAE